jgi:hypothetical protein
MATASADGGTRGGSVGSWVRNSVLGRGWIRTGRTRSTAARYIAMQMQAGVRDHGLQDGLELLGGGAGGGESFLECPALLPRLLPGTQPGGYGLSNDDVRAEIADLLSAVLAPTQLKPVSVAL